MKIIEKLAKKFTRSASSTVKAEVKKTAIDFLPTVAAIATAVISIVIFKGSTEEKSEIQRAITNTTVTTNNYFFRDMSEESIKKILED